MAKIVSAIISILLLVLADKVATEWKRIRGMHELSGSGPVSIQSVEAHRIATPQGAPSSNIVMTTVTDTDEF